MLTRPWLVAAIASALLSGEASAQGSWTPMKPIPQGANEVIGAAVDGRLYVYGGERMQTQHVYGGVNLKTQPLGIFWSYDPKADTWNQLKANPVPSTTGLRSGSARNSMCSAVSASPIREGSAGIPKTRFGFTTARHKVGRRCRRCRRCGARSPLWAKIPVGMELSDGLTAGGRVEVVGTMEVFDTEKNSWTTLKSMPLARRRVIVIGESSYSRSPPKRSEKAAASSALAKLNTTKSPSSW